MVQTKEILRYNLGYIFYFGISTIFFFLIMAPVILPIIYIGITIWQNVILTKKIISRNESYLTGLIFNLSLYLTFCLFFCIFLILVFFTSDNLILEKSIIVDSFHGFLDLMFIVILILVLYSIVFFLYKKNIFKNDKQEFENLLNCKTKVLSKSIFIENVPDFQNNQNEVFAEQAWLYWQGGTDEDWQLIKEMFELNNFDLMNLEKKWNENK